MKEGVELSPLLPTPPQPPQAAPLAGKRRLWPASGASGRQAAPLAGRTTRPKKKLLGPTFILPRVLHGSL